MQLVPWALTVSVLAASLTVSAQPEETVDRERRADRLITTGERYLAAGDSGTAASYFRDAIEVDPDAERAYQRLGWIYLDDGREADAVEVFEAGLNRTPRDSPLWQGLALALERQGQLLEAASALRTLTSEVPRDPHGWQARAELARRQGAWSEALNAYRAILDLDRQRVAIGNELLVAARRYIAGLSHVALLDPVAAGCAANSSVARALAACR